MATLIRLNDSGLTANIHVSIHNTLNGKGNLQCIL